MRRLVLVSAVLGAVAAATVPALAQPPVPPVPVGVTHGSNGVCVTVSYMVPQCVPTDATR